MFDPARFSDNPAGWITLLKPTWRVQRYYIAAVILEGEKNGMFVKNFWNDLRCSFLQQIKIAREQK